MRFLLVMLFLNSAILSKGNFVEGYSILKSGRITSSYGKRKDPYTKAQKFHSGVDIAASAGSSIYPVAPGIVSFSGDYEGYGRLVVIQHGNDVTSHYAHCWDTKVKVGDRVDTSTTIGFVGATGRATGPHVHFEIRFRGIPVNPEFLLSPKGQVHG